MLRLADTHQKVNTSHRAICFASSYISPVQLVRNLAAAVNAIFLFSSLRAAAPGNETDRWYIHLMSDPEGKSYFCFPESPDNP